MNENDSERIAGLLEVAGLTRTLKENDVVVINTCCIRENADNKFYGHLGNLKKLKEEDPSKRILVGGCLAHDQRRSYRAPHVDVVFGTHNLERVTELLNASDNGPIVEIVNPTPHDLDTLASETLPTVGKWIMQHGLQFKLM